jgi:hypothetical protein
VCCGLQARACVSPGRLLNACYQVRDLISCYKTRRDMINAMAEHYEAVGDAGMPSPGDYDALQELRNRLELEQRSGACGAWGETVNAARSEGYYLYDI